MTRINYYKILGLNSSATEKEIQRAYRILARRYHPDVNPGHDSSKKFQQISEAYQALTNPEKRRQHDLELLKDKFFEDRDAAKKTTRSSRSKGLNPMGAFGQRGHHAYSEEMRKRFQAQSKIYENKAGERPAHRKDVDLGVDKLRAKIDIGKLWQKTQKLLKTPILGTQSKYHSTPPSSQENRERTARSVSIVEVSVSVPEAIRGTKKTLEIEGGESSRKVSVKIPSGVFTGSMIRMRSEKLKGEELVLIIQVADHPWMSLDRNGLTITLPVSYSEAYKGTTLQVPTLDAPVTIKVPPRSRTGTLIRLKDKGPKTRDDLPTDLLFRVSIQPPENDFPPQHEALLGELESCYEGSLRGMLPESL